MPFLSSFIGIWPGADASTPMAKVISEPNRPPANLLTAPSGPIDIVTMGPWRDRALMFAHDPVHGQHLGILLVELGVGITVTGVLLSIFHAFAARGRF